MVDGPALTYTDVPPFGSLQMEGVKCVAAQFVLGVHSLVNLVGIILFFFFNLSCSYSLKRSCQT